MFNGTSAQKGYKCQESVNTAQRSFKITLRNEHRIQGFGKCVSVAYTNGETVKPIGDKLSYSTIKTKQKTNDATADDLIEQV